jgi:hypothetical protein
MGAHLKCSKGEALETLRNETVLIESMFLDSTEEGDFLIGYMKAESFQQAGSAVKKSVHEIDAYHRKFKQETWEKRKELELLIDLDRISEL